MTSLGMLEGRNMLYERVKKMTAEVFPTLRLKDLTPVVCTTEPIQRNCTLSVSLEMNCQQKTYLLHYLNYVSWGES